jgi:hypothetical protein
MPLFMASIKFSAASTKPAVEKPHDVDLLRELR